MGPENEICDATEKGAADIARAGAEALSHFTKDHSVCASFLQACAGRDVARGIKQYARCGRVNLHGEGRGCNFWFDFLPMDKRVEGTPFVPYHSPARRDTLGCDREEWGRFVLSCGMEAPFPLPFPLFSPPHH